MDGILAPLTGYLLGAVLLAVAVAAAAGGESAGALVLGHGGALLWAWAFWLQQPGTD